MSHRVYASWLGPSCSDDLTSTWLLQTQRRFILKIKGHLHCSCRDAMPHAAVSRRREMEQKGAARPQLALPSRRKPDRIDIKHKAALILHQSKSVKVKPRLVLTSNHQASRTQRVPDAGTSLAAFDYLTRLETPPPHLPPPPTPTSLLSPQGPRSPHTAVISSQSRAPPSTCHLSPEHARTPSAHRPVPLLDLLRAQVQRLLRPQRWSPSLAL